MRHKQPVLRAARVLSEERSLQLRLRREIVKHENCQIQWQKDGELSPKLILPFWVYFAK